MAVRQKGSGKTGRINRPGQGRKPIAVTAEQREMVERLSSVGETHEDIALCVGVTLDSLRKHCRVELDLGRIRTRDRFVKAVFEKAMQGNAGMLKLVIDLTARPDADETPYVIPEAKPEVEPKQPKLGKKEQQAIDAVNPDPDTPMGEMMAARARAAAAGRMQ